MRNLFYTIKPLIPRKIQLWLRRKIAKKQLQLYEYIWPINIQSGDQQPSRNVWPDNKQFALVLTHDVDNANGLANCYKLIERETELGFRSSFNFVPLKYKLPNELREFIQNNKIEIGVHGLKHDGKLYKNFKIFKKRADLINQYLKEWNSVGFRSPSMHHNLKWLGLLNIEYDSSTFDIDPFEPQPNGTSKIFPFIVKTQNNFEFVELPYTLPQDFTLFILLRNTNINIWKQKLDWIVKNRGMALLNTHPNNMHFELTTVKGELYPAEWYLQFLHYTLIKYKDLYWNALPSEISRYWKSFQFK